MYEMTRGDWEEEQDYKQTEQGERTGLQANTL